MHELKVSLLENLCNCCFCLNYINCYIYNNVFFRSTMNRFYDNATSPVANIGSGISQHRFYFNFLSRSDDFLSRGDSFLLQYLRSKSGNSCPEADIRCAEGPRVI